MLLFIVAASGTAFLVASGIRPTAEHPAHRHRPPLRTVSVHSLVTKLYLPLLAAHVIGAMRYQLPTATC